MAFLFWLLGEIFICRNPPHWRQPRSHSVMGWCTALALRRGEGGRRRVWLECLQGECMEGPGRSREENLLGSPVNPAPSQQVPLAQPH